MTPAAAGLLALAAVGAALDWAAKARGWRTRPMTKAAVIALLVGVALALQPVVPAQRGWVLGALALSLVGDLALLSPRRLAWGGLAFAGAHGCHLVGFALRDAPPAGTPGLGILLVAAVLVASTALPALREQQGTAVAAGAAAYLMVLAALVVGAVRDGGPLAVLGAGLFAASDLALLHDRARGGVRGLGVLATAGYHLAQGALVASLALG